MWKQSSILDYQQKDLCQDIWQPDHYLRPAVKEFVLSSIEGFFEDGHIDGYKEFIYDIWIGSSLASFFYKENTDFDIKIIIDIPVFKKYNSQFSDKTDETILDILIDEGRISFWLTNVVPDTYHNLDAYFYSVTEAVPIHLMKYDSLYSIVKTEWYKIPKKLPNGLSPAYVLDQAKQKASGFINKLDKDILTARRDTVDFLLLRDYLKNMDEEDLRNFETHYRHSFNTVNQDIGQILNDRDKIKELRHDVFTKDVLDSALAKLMGSLNYSDENMSFKLIQRYGYMKILTEISDLYKARGITPSTVKDFAGIL